MWKVGSSLEKGQSPFDRFEKIVKVGWFERVKDFLKILSFEYERVSNTDKIQILMNAG